MRGGDRQRFLRTTGQRSLSMDFLNSRKNQYRATYEKFVYPYDVSLHQVLLVEFFASNSTLFQSKQRLNTTIFRIVKIDPFRRYKTKIREKNSNRKSLLSHEVTSDLHKSFKKRMAEERDVKSKLEKRLKKQGKNFMQNRKASWFSCLSKDNPTLFLHPMRVFDTLRALDPMGKNFELEQEFMHFTLADRALREQKAIGKARVSEIMRETVRGGQEERPKIGKAKTVVPTHKKKFATNFDNLQRKRKKKAKTKEGFEQAMSP